MVAWALIVGINEYPAESKLPALKGAVADAVEFAEWALHPQGGGVDPAHLLFWTHPAPAAPSPELAAQLAAAPAWPTGPADLTRAPRATEIKQAAFRLAQDAGPAGVDRLYVFFAGHGVQTSPRSYDDDPQTCLVAADYAYDFPTDGIVACDDMRRALTRVGPAEVIVFLDCCRSPLPVNQTRPVFGGGEYGAQNYNVCCGVGSAASPGAQAFETPEGAPTRGAFSKLLLFGLRQLRENGELTADRLRAYLVTGIVKLANNQTPVLDVYPTNHPLVIAAGPKMGDDPNLVIDVTNLPGDAEVVLKWPDLSTTPIPHDAVVTIPAPIGTYSLETPQAIILQVLQHTGPEDTNVVLA
jgi:uncharacterized caspase-like protein